MQEENLKEKLYSLGLNEKNIIDFLKLAERDNVSIQVLLNDKEVFDKQFRRWDHYDDKIVRNRALKGK